jgi:glycosyltransferase involved in cell wall biosynthesis
MAKLSVVVVTLNEEKNIRRCLDSVRWADEIVVVDSFSTDRTLEIARTYTDKVFQYPYPGYSKQVERGIEHATGDWIFILDADEEVSSELAEALRTAIHSPTALDGYYVNRKVFVFGKWIKYCGWFPDWQFRLMRKDKIAAEHLEVHGAFKSTGATGKLDGFLNHYTYETIEQYIAKMNDYTSLQVWNKLQDTPDVRVVPWKLLLSPMAHFLQMYIVRKGYKEGKEGLLLSALDALYTLSFYAKVWEYSYRKHRNEPLPPITNVELQQFKARYHEAAER